MKIGFLGAGAMGGAILSGAVKTGVVKAEDIYATRSSARQSISWSHASSRSMLQLLFRSSATLLTAKP